ncbi:hypothetical protein [Streptomyces xantholiticus]|uniref:hypothetical protein n=1 Tax=Streptomyces xantholiticus TaxID=68285 RepID=UPI001676B6C3|nr:hypothetical protein [Streptomyces xantholiticus]GGW43926.1 hypothetical protein GCM10010381_31250 [Streptomyces xantholiticus]
MPASEHAAKREAEKAPRPRAPEAPPTSDVPAVSMRDLLAACAAASAVSTPPRASGATHRDAA